MRGLCVILLVAGLVASSCATRPREQNAVEGSPNVFQPTPLNDEWSRWIVGRWQGSDEGDPNRLWQATIEPDLNGQFLFYRTEARPI